MVLPHFPATYLSQLTTAFRASQWNVLLAFSLPKSHSLIMTRAGALIDQSCSVLIISCPFTADFIMARVNTTACIVYIDGAEFDGIYIVDGLGIMWDGVYNSEIIRVVQESLRAGKMVAAVGHGVAALCNVTDDRGNFIVAGKQVRSWLWQVTLSCQSACCAC